MLWTLNQNLEYIIRIITRQKTSKIVRQPNAVVIFEQPKFRKVNLYLNVYIHLGCLRKKIDDVYIHFLGCQMVEKSSTFGISKRSPRKIVSRNLFLRTLG